MRIRIVLFILSACLFMGSAINAAAQITNYRKLDKEYTAGVKNLEIEHARLLDALNIKQAELEASGKSILTDNVEVGKALSQITGANLLSIKAFSSVDGVASEIVSTTNVNDISFFKESVQLIQYNFEIKNKKKFLNDLKSTLFFTDSMYIRLDTKTAQLNVVPSKFVGEDKNLDMQIMDQVKVSFLEGSSDEQNSIQSETSTVERDDLGGELDLN